MVEKLMKFSNLKEMIILDIGSGFGAATFLIAQKIIQNNIQG